MRKRLQRMVVFVGAAVAALVLLVWIGLRIKPRTFADISQTAGDVETVALPEDLPAPVERFFSSIYGDRVPVITPAV